MSQLKVIQKQIENILVFLESHLSLANSHMVDYFTKCAFETCIPDYVVTEILKFGYENTLNTLLSNELNVETPKLNDYINMSKALRLYNLKNVCLNTEELISRLKDLGCKDVSSLKLQVFVTPKKSHEVEILSAIAAAICSLNKTTHLIDIGDGKGYLSSMLALYHRIPVLGIDASLINTDGAIKRVQKLERVWTGIAKSSKQNLNDINQKLYRQVTQYVTETTNFKQLIENVFLEESSRFGLVGLHTCGNLGADSVKVFNKDRNIRTLCNVSCCYHLLTEEFPQNSSQEVHGFPLSAFLKARKIKLGRNARMLSSQSIDRILHKKELPHKIIFYRALLEILFKKYNSQIKDKQVGKIRKDIGSFNEYVRAALKNIDTDLPVTEKELDELFEKYKSYEVQLHVFHLLRCLLAPVIESLILLDRCLFLHENNHECAFLVQLFDPVISPRCYGLIALKKD